MSEGNHSDITLKIYDWCSGDWKPESKQEEDEFLDKCSKYIGKNCKKNPGKLGEWAVCHILDNCEINQRVKCNWLLDQLYILPDL